MALGAIDTTCTCLLCGMVFFLLAMTYPSLSVSKLNHPLSKTEMCPAFFLFFFNSVSRYISMFIQCPFKTLLTFVRAIFTNIFSRNYAILVLNIKKKKKNGTPSNFKHKQNPNFHHFSYHNSRVVIVFSISHFVPTSALISIPIYASLSRKTLLFPIKILSSNTWNPTFRTE